MFGQTLLSTLVFVRMSMVSAQFTTAADPHCVCTMNIPERGCVQASNSAVDDQFVKSSIIALQSQIQQLMRETAKLQEEVQKINKGANVKQCSKRNLNDGRENGPLMVCVFEKKQSDTVMRVVWNGDVRQYHLGSKPNSCRRWYFSLNNDECSQPDTIDMQIYAKSNQRSEHRPSYMEGYCRGIPAGTVNVSWNVGDCSDSSNNAGDSFTGWITTSRIIVEEVTVEHANRAIG